MDRSEQPAESSHDLANEEGERNFEPEKRPGASNTSQQFEGLTVPLSQSQTPQHVEPRRSRSRSPGVQRPKIDASESFINGKVLVIDLVKSGWCHPQKISLSFATLASRLI